MVNHRPKEYKPEGKFAKLNDNDKREVYQRLKPDSYVSRNVQHIADYLHSFGNVSAEQLVLMLALWLHQNKDTPEARQYIERLKGK